MAMRFTHRHLARTLALALALLVASAVRAPTQALAATGRETFDFAWRDIGVWDASSARFITAADGTASYCADIEKSTPFGLGLSTTQTYGSPEEVPAVVANVLVLGYPRTTSIAGRRWSQDDAYVITQIAVWMARGGLRPDGGINVDHEGYGTNIDQWQTSGTGDYAAVVAAAKSLYQSAAASGRLGSATLWHPLASSSLQSVVIVARVGDLSLRKVSANGDVSSGNALYSLAGARFGVYDSAACAHAVATLVTDAAGSAVAKDLPGGTYWVREDKAPAGFALDATVRKVTVTAGQTTAVSSSGIADAPLVSAPIAVQKLDGELGHAQGDATLAGAVFEIRFFAGVVADEGTLPSSPTRAWRVTTADLGGYVGAVLGDDRCATEGDELYRSGDAVVLPLGTVTVREVTAPAGYLVSDARTHVAHVVADASAPGGAKVVRVGEWGPDRRGEGGLEASVEDQVIRGGVRLGKVDAECGAHRALGGGTLEGTVMAIELASEEPVLVEGTVFARGQVVTTVTLDAAGRGETTADALPYGSYVAFEAQAPEGYLLRGRDAWRRAFSIREDGVVVDLSSEGDSVPNQVKRGDLDLTKVAEGRMERLGRVAFVIESQTTGEAHVTVTDANGYASTAASWNAHTDATNASDRAVRRGEDGTWEIVDEGALDDGAGVWFSGATDITTPVDDALGALPYDSYTVTELKSAANEGLTPVSFTICVTRHAVTVGAGTVTNLPGPSLQTTLTDAATGAHVTQATGKVTLTDLVICRNLEVGVTYDLEGTLHVVNDEGDDAGELVGADGKAVRATASFLATASDCAQAVSFTADVSRLAGRSLVAFETLSANGEVVAEHADIADEGQTVGVSLLATTLSQDGAKEVAAVGTATVTDTVRYQGLLPGVSYAVRGALMDRDTGAAATDATGPIGGSTVFTPTSPEGTVDVAFVFDAASQAGRDLVAFETLEQGGTSIVVHADLDNAAQTVSLPAIGTVATNATTGAHEVPASPDAQIKDTVSYRNLEPGATYELSATLVDAATGTAVTDAGGGTVGASLTFSAADTGDGSQELPISLDASELAGRSVVVFEALYRDGRLVAEHADATDADQTLRIAPAPAEGERLPRTADEAADVIPYALAGLSATVLGGILLALARSSRHARGPRPRYTLPPRR